MSQNSLKPRVLPRLKLRLQHATVTKAPPGFPKESFRFLVAFTEKEEMCPFVIINGDAKASKVASQLGSIYLTKMEILKSQKILEFLLTLSNDIGSGSEDGKQHLVERSFFDSAVFWYSKPFMESDKGRVRIDANAIYEGDNKRHLALHARIIDLRNKLIAHQTLSYEWTIPVIALNPDETKKEIVEIYYDMRTTGIFNINELHEMIQMTYVACEKINNMICRREDKLLDELNSIGMDYLYSVAAKRD